MKTFDRSITNRLRWGGLLALCSLTLVACGKTAASAQAAVPPAASAVAATAAVPPAEVASMVSAASQIKTLPSNIVPALGKAALDQGTFVAQEVVGDVNGKQVSCNPTWNQVEVPSCVWGDPNSSHTVVLMGDSHAAQWITAFDQIGKRLHWKIVLLTKSACGAPDISFYNYANKGPYPACNQWHTYAINRINQLHPAAVVLSSDVVYPLNGRHQLISASTWTAGMVKTLNAITAPGVQKIVLSDVPSLGNPYPGEVAANCLALHPQNVQACSTPTSIATRAGLRQANQAGAEQGGAAYINVTPWFCSSTCTAVVGNTLVYADAGHITTQYADFVSGALQAALQKYIHIG